MTAGPIRVAVSGSEGQMGTTVCRAVSAAADMELVAAVDPVYSGAHDAPAPAFTSLDSALDAVSADVVVDFTRAEAARANIATCLRRKVAIVVGTTGFQQQDMDEIVSLSQASGTPVLIAPNFALGAVLMMQFAQQAAAHFDACEIVELHHDRKLDAPSGTAKRTGEQIEDAWRQRGCDKSVPIHSVRLPGLVAHQEVIFGSPGQTLTIRHDSLARESFMPGVLLAVRRVRQLQGVVVGLENLF